MDQPGAQDEVEFVAQLYERALDTGHADLAATTLARLARDAQAETAWWLVGRLEAGEICSIELHGAHGASPAPAVLAALAAAASTRGASVAISAGQVPGLLEAGVGHLLLHVCAHPGTLFHSFLWLQRGIGAEPFAAADGARLDRRVPHLVRAVLLAQKASLKLDPALQQMGRRNRGAACLCDASGAVFAVSPVFVRAVREHFPDWDGLRLPFAVPALDQALQERGPARSEMLVGGLHLRVARRGPLCILHVRALHAFDELTRRERDVVQAIVGGRSFKSLAQHLGVSPSTVANHASNIYRKLGVYSRDAVVELARGARAEKAG